MTAKNFFRAKFWLQEAADYCNVAGFCDESRFSYYEKRARETLAIGVEAIGYKLVPIEAADTAADPAPQAAPGNETVMQEAANG